jgi:hypothetical protein
MNLIIAIIISMTDRSPSGQAEGNYQIKSAKLNNL